MRVGSFVLAWHKDELTPRLTHVTYTIMTRAFISLGSNTSDASSQLVCARTALQAKGFAPVALSPVYLTEPQGYTNQPWFANQVMACDCPQSVTPHSLLACLLSIETRLGRVRSPDPALRFGPRVIDLDLLLFGNAVIHTPQLILPHPRMAERAFVLRPLLDIAPELVLPDGQRASALFKKLTCTVDGCRIFQS